MSTGNQNLDLLIKLLGMTQSSNDAEALLASRKANEQVAKFKTTWNDLLRGRVTIVADPFGPAAASPVVSSAPPSAPPFQRADQHHAPAPPPVSNPYTQAQPVTPPRRKRSAHSSTGRSNQYDSICCVCVVKVPAGKGIITGQTANGKWRVQCGPNWGHNLPSADQDLNMLGADLAKVLRQKLG